MKIGQTIINIRKEQKMSQAEFAQIFSITRQTVSNWENEKSYPDLQTLVNISEKFEISLDSMLKDNVDMVKKIDKDRHIVKWLKGGMVVLAGVLGVLCAIWTITWNNAKKEVDTKFQQGLKQYGFEENTDQNAYQYPYKKEVEEGICYVLSDTQVAEWYSFNIVCYNQELICYVQQEDYMAELHWYGEAGEVSGGFIYDKTGRKEMTAQERKKLLRNNTQLSKINEEAVEMCRNLYIDKYNMKSRSDYMLCQRLEMENNKGEQNYE